MSGAADAVLLADSMGRAFGRTEVLKSATLWAREGRVTVLFGRNGAGKTTLLRAAVGLIRRDFGTVRYLGRHRPRPRLHRLAREGLFFLPDRSLLSNRFSIAGHLREIHQRFGTRWDDAVELVGLEDHLDKRPLELSGGERRRAAVALALQRRPRCLLADEPLEGIEPRDQDRVGAALAALARSGAAVVLTGHDVEPLFAVADEVVWMVAGTTHGLGTPERARAHDQFRREYLGPRRLGEPREE